MFGDVYNIIVETGELHWTDWNDYTQQKCTWLYITIVAN